MDDPYYERKKEAAQRTYGAQPLIHSPFFDDDVALDSGGFRHLTLSATGERRRQEQIQRFTLLPLGLHVLRTATTVQAYRKRVAPFETPGGRGGLKEGTTVQWWAFTALFVTQDIKVRVVVRKVGDGKLHFWSVMLATKRARRTGPDHAARAS